ncbi:MAG: hypothetical protein MI725_04175, partial [Pirellulales bacterium]|nr:hypothetical protein [Pirellulales bacterium]
GHITFRPRIARFNNGKWGIIFGNGYNSDSEKAQLFILDAADGSLIAQIDTQAGSAAATNGLGEVFLLDSNGDRIVDFVYGGDLLGNVWKFDLTDGSASNWGSAYDSSGTPVPLYSAVDDKGTTGTADDTPQPITTRPVLATHPDGGFMVMFGTGKYLEPSDNTIGTNPDVNSFYGVRDNGSALGSGRTNLTEQIIEDEIDVLDTGGSVVNRARIVSDNTVNYSTDVGWFIDLLTPAVAPATTPTAEGEMIIADPLTRFSRALFTTFIPGDTPCDQGGQSVIMELDAVNGARLQNSVFDFNNDGVIDAGDLLAYGGSSVPGSGIFIPATLASPAVISASDASMEYKQTSGLDTSVTTTMEATGGITVGRQSWRQLK